MKEKFCKNCFYWFTAPGHYCTDECREEARKKRQTTVEARHTILLRILDREKVYRDPLRDIETYRAILAKGCDYCHADLLDNATGISLDRVTAGNHLAAGVTGCCKTCNRIKSSGPGEHDGFIAEEMRTVIGPAIAEVRYRREENKKHK